MPYLCLDRIYLNKIWETRTFLARRHVQPPLHTNGPPLDNCPGPQTVSPAPTALQVAAAALPSHTSCALLQHSYSRQRRRRVPWPDEVAPRNFLVLRPSGSTRLLSLDRLQRQSRAHT